MWFKEVAHGRVFGDGSGNLYPTIIRSLIFNVQEFISERITIPLGGILREGSTITPHQLIEDGQLDRKSTRLNSSHSGESRMPSSA